MDNIFIIIIFMCSSECPDCNFPRVCVVKGSTATCQCRHDYHVNHLGICVKDIGTFTVKPVLSGHSKRRLKIGFQDPLSLNVAQNYCRMLQKEHSALLSTFFKLILVIEIFVLSIYEWLLRTGLTVYALHVNGVKLNQSKLA